MSEKEWRITRIVPGIHSLRENDKKQQDNEPVKVNVMQLMRCIWRGNIFVDCQSQRTMKIFLQNMM